MNNKKVGIVTFHRAINYGAVLQAVALQKYISKIGYDSEIIDYIGAVFDHYKLNSSGRFSFLKEYYTREKTNRFKKFIRENTVLSDRKYNAESIYDINEQNYQYVITGSDQVWNPRIVNGDKAYMLDFVSENGKKISYAASIGLHQLKDADVKWLIDGLNGYRSVSVREKDAKKLLEEAEIAKPVIVCDPTLLLEAKDWEAMENPVRLPKRYVLVYSFGMDKNLWSQAKRYAKDKRVEICFINDSIVSSTTVKDIKGAGPAEWLYAIHNAECVFTNSYHGMLFSIIYRIPFFVSDPDDGTFSRFEDILELLGCRQREIRKIYRPEGSLSANFVITDSFDKFISGSKEYLTDVLSGKKNLDANLDESRNIRKEESDLWHVEADIQCTGCTACALVCPAKCITLLPDAYGSKFPYVDEKKCVQCGKCLSVCTKKIHEYGDANQFVQKYYALKNVDFDDWMNSSSGGAFILLMEIVLEHGGVIYGVKSTNGIVSYGRAEDINNAKRFCKSKYVECNKEDIFESVKKDLLEGRKVLFSGTPCTVAGLRNVINDELQENLYLVDIICHGTPVPVLYSKYIKFLEGKMGAKLTYLDFRDKVYDKDLHTHTYTQKIRAAFDNGRIYHGYMDRDPYYKLFWSNATLRDCCYDCQYATLKRYSDITIGDWWGDCSIAADFFADNAESSVLVNTSKGERLFNEIKSKAEILEVDANAIMQRNLKAPTPRGITYNMFWRDYHTHSFKYCLARYGDLYGLFRAYRKVRAHLKRK